MKSKNWFWGLFFIVAAALIIVNQLGYLTGVSLFSLVCTIFLIPVIIKSSMYLNFGGILIPMALLGIIYAEPLGITNLTPWPILATAIFGSIGLSLIFHKPERYHKYWKGEHKEEFDQVINNPDENTVDCRVSFGSSIKYVNTDDFQKGYFNASFGALKVYFDNAKIQKGEAQIYIDVSFAGAEIYIPKEWRVINGIDAFLGGVDEKNSRIEKEGSPTVYLKGKVSFGGIEIIYV